MRRELVVAKEDEELAWLGSVPSDWKIKVYSKADKETNKSFVKLPKIGKTAHTYLTFLTSHYDDLPDQMAFVQGNPFPACPDLLEILDRVEPDLDFGGLSDDVVLFEGNGAPYLSEGDTSTGGKTFGPFFEEIFGYKPPPLLCCALHSQFVVHKKRVLARSKAFYARALSLVSCKRGSAMNEERFLEYLWHQMFRGDDSLTLDLPDDLRDRLKVILAAFGLARLIKDREYSQQLLLSANQRINHYFAGLGGH